jgi:hypothetical protein
MCIYIYIYIYIYHYQFTIIYLLIDRWNHQLPGFTAIALASSVLPSELWKVLAASACTWANDQRNGGELTVHPSSMEKIRRGTWTSVICVYIYIYILCVYSIYTTNCNLELSPIGDRPKSFWYIVSQYIYIYTHRIIKYIYIYLHIL